MFYFNFSLILIFKVILSTGDFLFSDLDLILTFQVFCIPPQMSSPFRCLLLCNAVVYVYLSLSFLSSSDFFPSPDSTILQPSAKAPAPTPPKRTTPVRSSLVVQPAPAVSAEDAKGDAQSQNPADISSVLPTHIPPSPPRPRHCAAPISSPTSKTGPALISASTPDQSSGSAPDPLPPTGQPPDPVPVPVPQPAQSEAPLPKTGPARVPVPKPVPVPVPVPRLLPNPSPIYVTAPSTDSASISQSMPSPFTSEDPPSPTTEPPSQPPLHIRIQQALINPGPTELNASKPGRAQSLLFDVTPDIQPGPGGRVSFLPTTLEPIRL